MPALQTYRGVYLWQYIPSQPAAIAFAVLFSLATAAHGWKMIRTRMWFCLPFVIGGIFEGIGYVARTAAYNSTGDLGLYIVQGTFLVLPPILFAASLYMVYSRLVRAVHGQEFSPITPRWSTAIFVFGDWNCLNIQSAGAGLLANPKNALTGDYIIVTGLIIQILIFVGFLVCCVTFNNRFRAHMIKAGITSNIPWQPCLNMMYATSLAILIRNIYRVIEFLMGQDGYLLSTEWPLYVFDATLMLLVMVSFYVWYPNRLRLDGRESMIELGSSRSVDRGWSH